MKNDKSKDKPKEQPKDKSKEPFGEDGFGYDDNLDDI